MACPYSLAFIYLFVSIFFIEIWKELIQIFREKKKKGGGGRRRKKMPRINFENRWIWTLETVEFELWNVQSTSARKTTMSHKRSSKPISMDLSVTSHNGFADWTNWRWTDKLSIDGLAFFLSLSLSLSLSLFLFLFAPWKSAGEAQRICSDTVHFQSVVQNYKLDVFIWWLFSCFLFSTPIWNLKRISGIWNGIKSMVAMATAFHAIIVTAVEEIRTLGSSPIAMVAFFLKWWQSATNVMQLSKNHL